MSIGIKIDESIKSKLKVKHNVECHEVAECFANVTKGYLEDTRESHRDPTTYWFVEQTDYGRYLFIAFLYINKEVVLKTAFGATDERKKLYIKLTGK